MSAHRHLRPLPSRRDFAAHVARNVGLAGAVVATSLSIGAAGYHVFEHQPWIDAYLNASMILTGMGPLDRPATTDGKLFATAYALFSGLIFLFTAALLLTPVFRRWLHRLHLDMEDD
jgi:hypothetical protein